MSKYMKLTENEVLPVSEDVSDMELESLKERVLHQLQEEVGTVKRTNLVKQGTKKDAKIMKRIAAAAIILGITAPTAVYAAGKFGLFDGLFVDKDITPIEQYVESVNTEQAITEENEKVKRPENPIYQMENEDYVIKVDNFVFSEATDYGIVQFTLTEKKEDSNDWYEVAQWDPLYRDWKVWDATEIFAGLGDNKLWFEVNGLMHQNNRCFMTMIDEQTYLCYLCFNDMKSTSMADSVLKLNVKESKLVNYGEAEEVKWSSIMKLDIPIGESLPNYTWNNENGELALVLSSVDFWLNDAPESSVYGSDIILGEISVQMKDGSEYIVHSDEQKIIDWFYSTQKDEGIWRNFASVIDLEEVVSFTVDGKVFNVKDAVKK